jgi:hypothetical protein
MVTGFLYRSPTPLPSSGFHTDRAGIFLAGSIEMGKAELWQPKTAEILLARGWDVYDPRRDDWDSSWVQSIDNPVFRAQVEWELEGLELAHTVLMYLQPGTLSPISLMELGMVVGPQCVVVCPDGFWRKGNVDVLCAKNRSPVFTTIDEALAHIGDPPDWSYDNDGDVD